MHILLLIILHGLCDAYSFATTNEAKLRGTGAGSSRLDNTVSAPFTKQMLELVHTTYDKEKSDLALADGILVKCLIQLISSLQNEQNVPAQFDSTMEQKQKEMMLWVKMQKLAAEQYKTIESQKKESQNLQGEIQDAISERTHHQEDQLQQWMNDL